MGRTSQSASDRLVSRRPRRNRLPAVARSAGHRALPPIVPVRDVTRHLQHLPRAHLLRFVRREVSLLPVAVLALRAQLLLEPAHDERELPRVHPLQHPDVLRFSRSSSPRWHIQQITFASPPNVRRLISSFMRIISRARPFSFFVSAAKSFCLTRWHIGHFWPRFARIDCIPAMKRLPFNSPSTFTCLKIFAAGSSPFSPHSSPTGVSDPAAVIGLTRSARAAPPSTVPASGVPPSGVPASSTPASGRSAGPAAFSAETESGAGAGCACVDAQADASSKSGVQRMCSSCYFFC